MPTVPGRHPLIQPVALPRLYHHGKETERAVVLYHGFTDCPQGFDELAWRFYERGCNVYVPRLPLHGYRDRSTRALEHLTCTLLENLTTESCQLTRGLGRHVIALGGSLGGSMTLYLAQTQQIDHAVSVSPFFMPIGFPVWLGLPVMTALAWLPDRYGGPHGNAIYHLLNGAWTQLPCAACNRSVMGHGDLPR